VYSVVNGTIYSPLYVREGERELTFPLEENWERFLYAVIPDLSKCFGELLQSTWRTITKDL
jgi:hypothetical protein